MSRTRDTRIVTGPFQPDLERAFVAEVERQKRSDPLAPTILLVGSNSLGLYLSRLAARNTGGVAGLAPMTFFDIAQTVARESLSREGLRPIPDVAQRLLARTLAASLPPGSCFHDIREKPGLEEALLSSIEDLRDGGVRPRDLRDSFSRGSAKTRELADLLESYETTLVSRRLIDRPGIMARAIEVLESPEGAGALERIARLWIYGFYDFNALQERLLRRLVERLPATIFFPWRPTDAFEYARPARDRLLLLGREETPAAPDGGAEDGRAAPLAALRARLFTAPGKPTGNTSTDRGESARSVRIISAPGEPREALEAVRAIVDLARQGVAFEDIGVLYRGGADYPALLAPLLEKLKIPFLRTGGDSLQRSRSARATMLLLDILETNFERTRVIDFLTVADLNQAVTVDASRAADEDNEPEPPYPADWDLLSRLAGIVSGRAAWREGLERLHAALAWKAGQAPSDAGEDDGAPPDPRLLREAARLPRLFKDLERHLAAIPLSGTWTQIAGSIAAVLKRFMAPTPDRRAILEILDRLAALQGISDRTRLAEFRHLLEFEIERSGRQEGHFQRGCLFLGDVLAARGLGFRATLILGLVEQSFPAPARQDPILLDHERTRLNTALEKNGRRLPIKAERSLEEQLLFALASSSAGERIVLTFPRLDPQTARERIPSSFLLRTLEALDGGQTDYDQLSRSAWLETIRIADLVPSRPAEAVLEREFDLSVVRAAAAGGRPADALLPGALPGGDTFYLRGLNFERLRWSGGRFTEVDGLLRSPAARGLLARRHGLAGEPLSPTRLGQYLTCPYSYFCGRVLNLAPLESPERVMGLSALDRGSLMHAVLHEFYAGLHNTGDLPLRRDAAPELKERLLKIAARLFGEYDTRGLAGPALLAEIGRAFVQDDLLLHLDSEIDAGERGGPEGYRPRHFEVRFGMQARRPGGASVAVPDDPLSTDRPVALPLEGMGEIRFKGQIDRIDLTADGRSARVIDYKSGRLDDYKPDSHSGGTALQLPVYMLAAEMLLPGTRVEAGRYQSVSRRGRFRRVDFTGTDRERLLEDLREIGTLAQEGISGGVFFHLPDEARQCANCDFTSICGINRGQRFEMKRKDPAVLRFLEFKERTAPGGA